MCRHCYSDAAEIKQVCLQYPKCVRMIYIKICDRCFATLKQKGFHEYKNKYCLYCGTPCKDTMHVYLYTDGYIDYIFDTKICKSCIIDLKKMYSLQLSPEIEFEDNNDSDFYEYSEY